MLKDYLLRVNELNVHLEFYYPLFDNRTVNLLRRVRAVWPAIGYSGRFVSSGYVHRHCYDLKLLNTRATLAEPRARSLFQCANEAAFDDAYSAAIRSSILRE